MKSDVEIYWDKVAQAFGIQVEFKELHPDDANAGNRKYQYLAWCSESV